MKKPYVSFLALCVAALPTLAHAGWSERAKVQNILTTPLGQVFFKVGPQSGAAACSTLNEWAFLVSGDNANGGKAMLASLLTAQAAGKDIYVVGTGKCDIWSDRETVQYVLILTN